MTKQQRLDKARADLMLKIRAERRWIEEHGHDRAGYIARYGAPGDPNCYGDGGSAIYDADIAYLKALEAQLRDLT